MAGHDRLAGLRVARRLPRPRRRRSGPRHNRTRGCGGGGGGVGSSMRLLPHPLRRHDRAAPGRGCAGPGGASGQGERVRRPRCLLRRAIARAGAERAGGGDRGDVVEGPGRAWGGHRLLNPLAAPAAAHVGEEALPRGRRHRGPHAAAAGCPEDRRLLARLLPG